MGFAAIVLAGGRALRMGGVLKPLLRVGGVPMLDRALAAVAGADPLVVVGPSELDDHLAGVRRVQEQPPGGGPVAGIAAGVKAAGAALSGADGVAVLGADLPFVTAQALAALRGEGACAVYVDGRGRRQPLVAFWSTDGLRGALEAVPGENASMKQLLAAVKVTELAWAGDGPPPWFDCDTPQALEEAERWL